MRMSGKGLFLLIAVGLVCGWFSVDAQYMRKPQQRPLADVLGPYIGKRNNPFVGITKHGPKYGASPILLRLVSKNTFVLKLMGSTGRGTFDTMRHEGNWRIGSKGIKVGGKSATSETIELDGVGMAWAQDFISMVRPNGKSVLFYIMFQSPKWTTKVGKSVSLTPLNDFSARKKLPKALFD